MSIAHWRETRKPFTGYDQYFEHVLALSDELSMIVTVFDLEGTSFIGPAFGITEVGAVHVLPNDMAIKGNRIFSAGSLVNPDNPIPRRVQTLTGIKPAMVNKLQNFKTLWAEAFQVMFRDHFVLGFNSSAYDVRAILNQSERYGCGIERPELHRDIKTFINREKGSKKGKLTDFMEEFGIQFEAQAHRATDDAIMTAMVLNEAIARFGFEGLIQGVKRGLTGKRVNQTREAHIEAIQTYLKDNLYTGFPDLAKALNAPEDELGMALSYAIDNDRIDKALIDCDDIQDKIQTAMQDANFDFDSAPTRKDGTLRLRDLMVITEAASLGVSYADLKVFALNRQSKTNKLLTAP